LLSDIEAARADGNWTALSSLQRIRSQYLGLSKVNVAVSVESAMTDVELIKRISGGNQEFIEVLGAQLAIEHSFS